jgi:hypothetical protein
VTLCVCVLFCTFLGSHQFMADPVPSLQGSQLPSELLSRVPQWLGCVIQHSTAHLIRKNWGRPCCLRIFPSFICIAPLFPSVS